MRVGSLKDHYKGKPIIVIGNSPSVNSVDKLQLDKFLTIGVNRLLRVYTPHYLLFCDPGIIKHEQDWLTRYKGTFLVYDKLVNHTQTLSEDNKLIWSLKGKPAPGASLPDSDILYAAGTTPAYACQVAALWGASVIGLIGVDFNAKQLSDSNVPTHCYGEGKPLKSSGGGGTVTKNINFYKWFGEEARNLGLQTYNLSPDTGSPFYSQSGWGLMSMDEFSDKFSKFWS